MNTIGNQKNYTGVDPKQLVGIYRNTLGSLVTLRVEIPSDHWAGSLGSPYRKTLESIGIPWDHW